MVNSNLSNVDTFWYEYEFWDLATVVQYLLPITVQRLA